MSLTQQELALPLTMNLFVCYGHVQNTFVTELKFGQRIQNTIRPLLSVKTQLNKDIWNVFDMIIEESLHLSKYYVETHDLGILKPLRTDNFYSIKTLGVKMSRNIPF